MLTVIETINKRYAQLPVYTIFQKVFKFHTMVKLTTC